MKGDRASEVHALLMGINDDSNVLRRNLPSSGEEPPEHPFHGYFFSATPGYSNTYLLPTFLYAPIPFAIVPIFYGLPHFLGWSKVFPTPLENQIWWISTCVVTASGFFYISATNIIALPPITLALVVIIMSILYIAASGFLLGESLRQLFFLEPATYQLASWSNYWPHPL